MHHGYFLPIDDDESRSHGGRFSFAGMGSDGPKDIAVAVFSFPDWPAYDPDKFGSLANHKQQPWKAPLPIFIEELYKKRFGRSSPENVVSLEELERRRSLKKQARREERQRKNRTAT